MTKVSFTQEVSHLLAPAVLHTVLLMFILSLPPPFLPPSPSFLLTRIQENLIAHGRINS